MHKHRGTGIVEWPFSVLTTVLDKLGNPSVDDPFNPDIAAVGASLSGTFRPTLTHCTGAEG